MSTKNRKFSAGTELILPLLSRADIVKERFSEGLLIGFLREADAGQTFFVRARTGRT